MKILLISIFWFLSMNLSAQDSLGLNYIDDYKVFTNNTNFTYKKILEIYGTPSKIKKTKKTKQYTMTYNGIEKFFKRYTLKVIYSNLGIVFCNEIMMNDKELSDSLIFTSIYFKKPFIGKTRSGIKVNETLNSFYVKYKGNENSLKEGIKNIVDKKTGIKYVFTKKINCKNKQKNKVKYIIIL